MKRLIRRGNVSLAAMVVLFAAFHYTRAQSPPPNSTLRPPGAAKMSDPPQGGLTLLKTYITQGFPESWYDDEYEVDIPIDGETSFRCPWEGCTLEFEQTVNVYGYDYEEDYPWFLGADVDGDFYWSGPMGTLYEDYLPATFVWSVCLGPGKHTVQSYLYSYDELYVESYHMSYRVYTYER